MNERTLSELAQLTGAFVADRNTSQAELDQLRTKVATALLSQQSAQDIRQAFRFETLADFHTRNLETSELQDLETLLKAAQDNIGSPIRAFRREVPFISSQVRGSVPEWARGARVAQTIGPLTDSQGRRFWWDFYTIYPGIQLFLQGETTPSIVLSLEVSWFSFLLQRHQDYVIPESSIWIHARLLSAAAPADQYCGLTVQSGSLHLSQNVSLNNSRMDVPPGTVVTITLNLKQQSDSSVSPDTTGIDAANASVQLPATFSFRFSNASCELLAAGDASWTLYDQPDSFSFLKSPTPFYLPGINRIGIPFQSAESVFEVRQCQSEFCNLAGKATVSQSAWSLSCAVLDVNHPLEASGIGAMMIQTDAGLSAGWMGLKDANLKAQAWANLRKPWVLLEPGRIAITDSNAGNDNENAARQQYKLWKSPEGFWNTVDLWYSSSFTFFYNCLQAGNESVLAITDCIGAIDKPVDVSATPFELKSKQTAFLLSWSMALKLLLLYDDNLLVDNNSDPNNIIPVFQPKALALNNALLTVSPITGFLLAAELKNEAELSRAILVYSFGLLGYLPTLPDPYAANLDVFQRVYRNYEGFIKEGGVPVTAVQQLLIALMYWENDAEPTVAFVWGDLAVTPNNAVYQGARVPIDLQKSQQLAVEHTQLAAMRQKRILTSQYQAANMAGTGNQVGNAAGVRGRNQNYSLFTLLDVSTNADLLGVDIGFVNDQYIFGETFQVEPLPASQNPLAIVGMDVVASSRFVRIFASPQISWEPVLNITLPFNATNDPPFGILRYDNDGFPAMIGNTGAQPVPLSPIPLAKEVVNRYAIDPNFKAWSLFTLPNGMVSVGRYNQTNSYLPKPNTEGARIELIQAGFVNDTVAGLQIVTKAGVNPIDNNTVFEGETFQETNVKPVSGSGVWSILGKTVTDIFNSEFGTGGVIQRGVPLERYDFTGYGAQVFSHWLNNNAEIAQVSQAIFDVWRGRVAKEIIQVRSLIYPWAIRVVRTITMYRSSTGFEYRVDSGWRADSDGIYDFSTKDEPSVNYVFHPGLVQGVYNVRNIVENDLAPFQKSWFKNYGVYVDPNDGSAKSALGGITLEVELVPVYFDADVFIHDVDGTPLDPKGVPKGQFVPSRKMLGYLQKSPRGVIIAPQDFAALLDLQNGLGGPVDCLLNVNGAGQKMRASGVEVHHSQDTSNQLVFVSAVKGMPVLPKDGSWSLVSHDKTSKQVTPLANSVVSLIRKGVLGSADDLNNVLPKEIAVASELFKVAEDRLTQFGFLQNTDTQKILYRNPLFNAGEKLLHSTKPDLGDAYRLLNSSGVFPNIDNLPSIDLDTAGCATRIIDEGYQMVDKAANNVLKQLNQNFPSNASFTFIDKPGILKVYIEYASTDKDGNVLGQGLLNLDLNSQVNNWVNKMNDVTMVVDLVKMKRLFLIQGKFDTKKGAAPEFSGPKLIPGNDLKPIIEILEVLEAIGSSSDYADAVKKGLQVVMSNSPNNWEYKFQADKEIPVLQFPPVYLDGPTTPLRLEANLKLGVYFNLAMPTPPTGLPAPSAGGFIEFGAKLSVMCVSLAAATVYAVGQVTLRITGDTITGPALYMKMGFGIELMVGIPVVGNVSVYYAVGIEVSLDTGQITIGAFILFRGQAQLLGGLVSITIQIEAAGKIHKTFSNPSRTDCIAQVTFSIDVSILFVIDIHDTESWQEARQIA
jgi:hypothetical protein